MKQWLFIVLSIFIFKAHAAGNYQAGQEKSVVCAACHGAAGMSTDPKWPNIAGQHEYYIIKQLKDFKNGQQRQAETMLAAVANLSLQDMQDLAVYYSNQPIPKGAVPKKFLKRGEQLYRGGDFAKKITACIACHGPDGMGNGQAGFPLVSGQHALYSLAQLEAFKNKERKNDLHAIMRDISQRMSQDDMLAVANYMSGLH